MRLIKARVTNYRSIKDTGWFEVEPGKTIMVGPNEAGKTAVLRALQQLNPPADTKKFDALRDYPRSDYNDITTKKVEPSLVTIVEGHFSLEPEDQAQVIPEFRNAVYVIGRKLDNTAWHRLDNAPPAKVFGDVKKDLSRLVAHVDGRAAVAATGAPAVETWATKLEAKVKGWNDETPLDEEKSVSFKGWISHLLPLIDEKAKGEEERYDSLTKMFDAAAIRNKVLTDLFARLPVFVLFNNYFKVRPLIHLEHLAQRLANNSLDDEQYDYGNQCLLRLLGFSARDLSNLGRAPDPAQNPTALQAFRDQLDQRSYQLNAASVRLSKEIRSVWLPNTDRGEADRLRVVADGQYLKVVVEDSLGVDIELDQRSEGFQWLVSFFVVFFAESAGKHKNAILLLDEPGLNLHGLKQRDFRDTITRLSVANQTIYTTHSPFLVGPDELDIVRVVEMIDRTTGTKIHSDVTSQDPAALLPLQEALGYDLAQSLFAQQRNLILEGLTDYWYIEAVSHLLREAKLADLNEKIALVPAQSAGKVVYFATILHAHKLKVAALLDSDTAGDQAARQDALVHRLDNKGILRTKDFYKGSVLKPEVEDLLRDTLAAIAKADLGWDVIANHQSQPSRPIIDIFTADVTDFSKYKLAKAFLRWTRAHSASELTALEREQWTALINTVNKVLK